MAPSGDPGRNSLPALQRVITVVSLLAESPGGVAADDLIDAAGYGGAQDGRREQLARDIRHLIRQGWRIENVAPPGTLAHYRLQPGDPRVRLVFDESEQEAFERAARLAGVSVTNARTSSESRSEVPGGSRGAFVLELVLHAQEHRCLLHFTYRDSARTVVPDAVWVDNDRWYLRGRQDGADARNFRVDRMADLALGAPGSAGPAMATRVGADPLLFSDGPQVQARVRTHPDHRRRIERSLGRAESVQRVDDRTVVLTIPVKSHLTFLRRLCELGTRAYLEGPDSLRDELRALLAPHLESS